MYVCGRAWFHPAGFFFPKRGFAGRGRTVLLSLLPLLLLLFLFVAFLAVVAFVVFEAFVVFLSFLFESPTELQRLGQSMVSGGMAQRQRV